VLVQAGTLNKGDSSFAASITAGCVPCSTKQGQPVREAGPSIPVVRCSVSPACPNAGDDFIVVADERLAKDVAQRAGRSARNASREAAGGQDGRRLLERHPGRCKR
jgi:translation initiation factor IF-2